MLSKHDPKTLAKRLRVALAARDIALSHSACLEIVAQQLGHADWNTAVAQNVDPVPHMVLPKGWVVGGDKTADFDVGVDTQKAGQPASIRSLHQNGAQTGFVTLMQSVDATAYHGKRVRLSADLSVEAVKGAATIWMRVDDAAQNNIRFDNMEMRKTSGPLIGTQDWQRRDIVLDVPVEGRVLNYGFYLRGAGQCWARRFAVDVVSDDVDTTDDRNVQMAKPMNLDFAEASARG